jgi:hypothetical protein
MSVIPDHVVRDVQFDPLNVEDAMRRLDHLEAASQSAVVDENETDRRTSVFLRSGDVQINVFAQKPELNVIVIRTDARSTIRYSLSMPMDQTAFDAIAEEPVTGLRSLIGIWRGLLEADPAKVATDAAMRGLIGFDHRDETLDALMHRAMRRTAAFISIHNPTRSGITQVVLCPPCMGRPGSIVDRNRKPILAKAVEESILSEVPNVAVVSRPDPGRFQISRHEIVQYQKDLVDGDVIDAMRTIAGLPQVAKPLLKAALAND